MGQRVVIPAHAIVVGQELEVQRPHEILESVVRGGIRDSELLVSVDFEQVPD